jgi:hypothetical protein
MLMWSTCSLLARAGITCYSFHAVCITADRIGLTAAAEQECAQPHLHSGHAPYYSCLLCPLDICLQKSIKKILSFCL